MRGFGRGPRRAPGARQLKAARRVGAAPFGTAPPGSGRGVPARRGSDAGLGRRIVTPGRAAGLLGMLATGFLFTLATGQTAFGLSRTDIPQLQWTDREAVVRALALPEGGNVVRLETGPLEAALEALPGVAAADVSVQLPDAAVVVTIEERRPVLAWQVRGQRYIADGDGAIFAILDASDPLPEAVTVIDDRRRDGSLPLAIGGRIDAVDLDVATRLGSVMPADVGSSAVLLQVAVTDGDGFVVSVPQGWVAVFGFYSPATRPADMIPGQVRLLHSLLDGREGTIRRVILASETDGTYIPRATPR